MTSQTHFRHFAFSISAFETKGYYACAIRHPHLYTVTVEMRAIHNTHNSHTFYISLKNTMRYHRPQSVSPRPRSAAAFVPLGECERLRCGGIINNEMRYRAKKLERRDSLTRANLQVLRKPSAFASSFSIEGAHVERGSGMFLSVRAVCVRAFWLRPCTYMFAVCSALQACVRMRACYVRGKWHAQPTVKNCMRMWKMTLSSPCHAHTGKITANILRV